MSHCEQCGSSHLVITSPARPGPDGWGERCKDCGYVRDISAEARQEVEEMEQTLAHMKRASREGQRNTKIHAAYLSAQYEGHDPRNDLLDVFSVASQSQPSVRYTVTVDLVTGASICDCPHGQHGGRGVCLHRVAVERKLAERAATINQQLAEAQQ